MSLIVLYLGTRYDVCESSLIVCETWPLVHFLWTLTFACDLQRGQMAEWFRRLTGKLRVPSSIPDSNSLCSCHSLQRGCAVAMVTRVGAKLTVKAQLVIAENTISVGHCVIPLSKGLVPHCSVVRWGLFCLHMHSICSELKYPGTLPNMVP